MNKTFELTKSEFESLLGKDGVVAMEKLNEAMSDIGRQIAHDQMVWVDKCMKDLLPPDLYDKAKRMENLEDVAAYAHKNEIKVIHLPDTLRMRIMVRGEIYGEWKANLTVDGESVKFEQNNNGPDRSLSE